ncbi:MAG: hypothetical protein NTV80_25555 [Verrucomicrobia bacterium]|nr:hypothetical protein [Verrucomicrobiota bacterium]
MKTSSYFALLAAHLVLAVPMVNAATDWPEQEMQQFMEEHDTGPLESKPGSRLQKDFEQKWLTWFRRVVVAPFQARIGANEGQSAKAVRLLEQGALQMRKSELADPSLNAAELARSCEEIIRSGLDDPLLLWVHSQAVYKASQNLPVAKDALNKARKHREFAKLPASSQYWVLAGVSAFYWKVQPGGKLVPSGEELIKAAAAMLTEEKAYLQAEDEVLDENLWPVFSERNLKGNEKQVQALSGSPILTEWARHMLTGRYHERLAWLARGHTFANDVTPEGWQGFEDQNLLAVKSFLKAWELRTDSPLAARELLGMELISEGSTGSESATWLARALEAQFDHLSTCRSLMNGLLPRWGGNHEKMLAFGVACAATRRFDTKLPYFFFESLEDVVKDAGDWKQVCRQPLVARVAIALCRQRVADAPTPELRQHALALQAGFGWLCGDYAAAQEALTQNEQPFSRAVVLEMLSYEGFNENLVRGESAIFAAGMADEWSKAINFLKAKNWEEAEKGFERVRGKLAGPAARLAASSLATARI